MKANLVVVGSRRGLSLLPQAPGQYISINYIKLYADICKFRHIVYISAYFCLRTLRVYAALPSHSKTPPRPQARCVYHLPVRAAPCVFV